MPLEQFPYTNFHELNLDWVIKVVKDYQAKVNKLEIDFIELHEYVMNYFDSVDFAQLVNDKIDELVNNGDFTTLFATYTTRIYNTLADMKADSLLVDGSHARTLGYYAAGDGGGAEYLIKTTTPLTWYEVLTNGLNAELVTDAVNILQMGAIADGVTDNATIINRAISEHDEIIIPEGQFASNKITLDSNKRLKVHGEVIALQTPLFEATNMVNTVIEGGKYSTALSNGTCFDFDACNSCIIRNVKISGFKNKGIAITDGVANILSGIYASGADGTTGAGISLSGTSQYNNLDSCYVESSRIGIIMQSCYDNNVSNVNIKDCTHMGFCCDGTVSGSGDGAYNINVENIVITGQTNSSYGGIYLGNGSHDNVFSNFQVHDCYTGVKSNGGAGYEPSNNRFTNGVIKDCSHHGFQMSYGKYTFIDNVMVDGCVIGINLLYSDYSQVANCSVMNNTSQGFKIMSGYCCVIANKIISNAIGVQFAYGGSTPVNNSMFNNTFASNSTDASLSGSPVVANNVNYTP